MLCNAMKEGHCGYGGNAVADGAVWALEDVVGLGHLMRPQHLFIGH
jgi:hypothetical protein